MRTSGPFCRPAAARRRPPTAGRPMARTASRAAGWPQRSPPWRRRLAARERMVDEHHVRVGRITRLEPAEPPHEDDGQPSRQVAVVASKADDAASKAAVRVAALTSDRASPTWWMSSRPSVSACRDAGQFASAQPPNRPGRAAAGCVLPLDCLQHLGREPVDVAWHEFVVSPSIATESGARSSRSAT